MSSRQTLKRIADRLTNIDIEELTTAEGQIARILEKEGIIYKKEFEGEETIYKIKKVKPTDTFIAPPYIEMEDVPDEMWEFAKELHEANPKELIKNIKALRAKFNVLGLKNSKMILDKVRGVIPY